MSIFIYRCHASLPVFLPLYKCCQRPCIRLLQVEVGSFSFSSKVCLKKKKSSSKTNCSNCDSLVIVDIGSFNPEAVKSWYILYHSVSYQHTLLYCVGVVPCFYYLIEMAKHYFQNKNGWTDETFTIIYTLHILCIFTVALGITLLCVFVAADITTRQALLKCSYNMFHTKYQLLQFTV